MGRVEPADGQVDEGRSSLDQVPEIINEFSIMNVLLIENDELCI